ncbi:polyphosphate kinase 2 family protein [Priestia flexa]|uniref:polyphosphate kinase 2 family protein n=1 Tax=Priestia flexa TaxID=86664 RepID=UPI001B318C58|nr:UDP-galactose-lipid carrier transferase [Priestia flexa]
MNLEDIDLSKKISSKKEYKKKLKSLQLRLLRLEHIIYMEKVPIIFAFEGWDAAGKGGAIKRITQKLDPRGFHVYPISAPTDDERSYHYLHRFWTRLPHAGQIALFDRSWYGRVLVERVENLISTSEWGRAYEEINQFERTLTDNGYIVAKFWFHISKDEQLKRFKEREADPFKRWKLTEEDWRNRNNWDEYEEAVEHMFKYTNTNRAPWFVIAGNDKQYARVKTLSMMISYLEQKLMERGIRV